MVAMLKNVYYDILKNKLCHEEENHSYKVGVFSICNSCFWCASILYNDVRPFRACPNCMNYELEFMPISTRESYKFDYDKRHGVTLEFFKRDRIH